MVRMKRSLEKAKKAVERLFCDICCVETFSEETAAWGESLHEKGEGETFPCRLTEKAGGLRHGRTADTDRKDGDSALPCGEEDCGRECGADSAGKRRGTALHCGRRQPDFSDAQGGWTEKG